MSAASIVWGDDPLSQRVRTALRTPLLRVTFTYSILPPLNGVIVESETTDKRGRRAWTRIVPPLYAHEDESHADLLRQLADMIESARAS
jgi:hypothetical protein